MRNLLDELYQTKLQLIAVISMVGGVMLLMLARWVSTSTGPQWLDALPLPELGSTLFGTGLLAVFFEYVDRKHGDERTDQRIRRAVRHEAPAIRDAVVDSLAFNADTLKGLASPETLDRIATNALGLRLDDQVLASEVYTDVRDQIVQAPERWRDLRISINLSLPPGNSKIAGNPMFVATIRREYRVRPATNTLRFASVSDPVEYRELLRDPTIAGQWYFENMRGLDAASPEAFELVQVSVNGRERPIRSTSRKGAQLYSASLGVKGKDREMTVAYTYRALIQQHGHVLYLDIPRPTKGLQVEFSYAQASIRYVNTVDFIASTEEPRITPSPASVPERTVSIGFDGWVFPKSGVAFVWVLEGEMQSEG